jgi:integral membrane sensor domain MASE1/signal transduction histidine kinase
MKSVWSHRPPILHLGLFVAIYVLGCGFAQALAIVPGTGISIWPPSGLFIATLVLTSRPSWPWWVLGGCLAELFSNFLWFESPLPAAFLIYVGNALEAAVGASLVNRTFKGRVRLETVPGVLAFIVLGAGIAPMVSATVGSATLAWFGILSQTFTAAWPLWWIGDATGVLIVAPLALVILQNWRGKARLSAARWMEAGVLGLIFLGVAALSLSGYLPFAYIIMPPLLWAAVRFEFKGVAVSLALLALITAAFTISGASQFSGDLEAQKHNQIMLQLFLAISAFSALIVAAISQQHHQAVLTLRQSERSLREHVEALRQSEQRLQQMIDAVPVRVWSAAPGGGPVIFNRRYLDHLRSVVAHSEDLQEPRLEKLLPELVHPEDAPEVWRTLQNSSETGGGCVMRFRWRQKDGDYCWAECRVEPWRDEDGTIVQWYGVSLDIDDEVRAQEALRRGEEQLQQMIDAVPVRLWRATASGQSPYFNKRYRDYLRSIVPNLDTVEESRFGQLMLDLMHPDDAPELERTMRQCFTTGSSFAMRFRRLQKDGSYRWEEGRAEPLRDEDGRILQWYGVALDIDDEIRAQEGLRQASDKLARANQAASLAELSASIAHEVNQPLAAIVANSHACQRWLTAETPNIERAQKTVERVIRDANAAADIVRRIHALFKRSTDTRLPTAFGSIITEARDLMAEEAARRGVRLDVEVESELPLVALDHVQVQQVLINLMRNGMDAMESVPSDRALRARARRVGDVVQTEISDRGPGIAFPDRIFEPFFTTKENGMGMGLAICRSIVESHGGRLWAEQNELQGATFIFTLPTEAKTES